MKKLYKLLKNPIHYLSLGISFFLDLIFKKKLYLSKKKFRSNSDNGFYGLTILSILKSEKKFYNFKRDHNYRKIIEHVTKNEGLQYLQILEKRNDGILEKALKTVFVSDDLGNPIKFFYDGYDFPFSPTTLRYTKVASDLKQLFGENLKTVAEIGCGYGGQTLVNDHLLKFNFVKLFDLSIVNKLIERYLESHLLKSTYKTTTINKELVSKYELVISNYAFSELPRELQIIFINKVLSQSRRGYLTMNSGISGTRSIGKLSLDELRKLLPKFEIFEEVPLTSPHNYIIIWGFDVDKINNNFYIKKL